MTQKMNFKRDSNRMIYEAQVFINENICEPITIYEVCNYVKVSESYFSRVFKSKMKITPYTFIQNAKVEKAKELLDNGMDISQVAFQIGFADQSHLNRVFKKYASLTPNQYKKKEIVCK
jgi:two-component system response regulator YesN